MSNPAPKPSAQNSGNETQPSALYTAAPFLLIGVVVLLAYLGMLYVDTYGGQFSEKVYAPYRDLADLDGSQVIDETVMLRNKGMRIFNANCSPCHQNSGLGVPGQFPPLAGSEWVNAKTPGRIIRGVLCGLQGPIKVKDQPYNNVMVPWRDSLKDEDIAAVVTFIRQNKEWGNSASAVTPEQVSDYRKKVAGHPAAFTPDELLKLPED